MDDDIRDALKEVSTSVQAIGRMIASPKTGISELKILAESLRLHADTLDTWKEVQIMNVQNPEEENT